MSKSIARVTSLQPGEPIVVQLRGRATRGISGVSGYAGSVISVDGVAIRLRPTWCRFELQWRSAAGGTDVLIPWGCVASVGVGGAS